MFEKSRKHLGPNETFGLQPTLVSSSRSLTEFICSSYFLSLSCLICDVIVIAGKSSDEHSDIEFSFPRFSSISWSIVLRRLPSILFWACYNLEIAGSSFFILTMGKEINSPLDVKLEEDERLKIFLFLLVSFFSLMADLIDSWV